MIMSKIMNNIDKIVSGSVNIRNEFNMYFVFSDLRIRNMIMLIRLKNTDMQHERVKIIPMVVAIGWSLRK